MTTALPQPLRNARVLSLALNLPGPAALMRCARMGAECTKLEPPPPDPEVEEAWSALAPKIVSVPAPAPDAPETSPEPEDLAPVSPIVAPADGIATTRLDLALEVTVRVLAPEIRGAISPPLPPRLR